MFRGAGSTSSAFDRRGMVQNGVGWSTAGVRGNLPAALRKAESEVKLAAAFVPGTRRRRVVALIGEPPGVCRGGIDCGQGTGQGTKRKRDSKGDSLL